MFIGFLILNPRSCEVSGILLIFAHMEKFILQQAQALLDHLLDEVPCVLQDIEDLDPIEDYAEVKEAPSCSAFIHRVALEVVSGHRVLIQSGPQNRGLLACGTIHEATSRISS